MLKIAGAAAASGRHLDEVERLARLANERTVSLGVALGGCTLPGAREPLFSVPAEKMALGLGIHGEPGLEELDIPTADELAHLLVTRLLADIPPAWAESGATVIPVLNGLGAIKVEELFVVFRTVARLLTEGGLTVVDPEVGELCTSFDMEGCSLTLFFPDDEMRALWSAPAESAGYRKSKTESSSVSGVPRATAAAAIVAPASEGHVGDDSRAAGEEIARMLEHAASAIDEAADDLGRLDAIAGDGDHGIGMRRGVVAAREAARVAAAEGRGAGGVLHRAADAWADKAGGTSGVLWGQMLHATASEIGDSAAVSGDTASRAATAAGDMLRAFGGAEVGDKTMVDAVVPFVEEFAARVAQGDGPVDAWRIAADRAIEAAAATAGMSARRGRARTHGDRSLGTPDPGATSFALICTTIGREASVKEDAR